MSYNKRSPERRDMPITPPPPPSFFFLIIRLYGRMSPGGRPMLFPCLPRPPRLAAESLGPPTQFWSVAAAANFRFPLARSGQLEAKSERTGRFKPLEYPYLCYHANASPNAIHTAPEGYPTTHFPPRASSEFRFFLGGMGGHHAKYYLVYFHSRSNVHPQY